jgi:hypothetical protein
MGSFMKMAIVLLFAVLVFSCASKNYQIPDKYALDSQLEKVDVVNNVRMGKAPAFTTFNSSFEDPQSVMQRRDTVTFSESQDQWIKVDQQSFIIRSSANTYYLLVLNMPAIGIMSTDTISFALASNNMKAKADFLELGGVRYIVDRIYKINSTDQMNTIRNQILTSAN